MTDQYVSSHDRIDLGSQKADLFQEARLAHLEEKLDLLLSGSLYITTPNARCFEQLLTRLSGRVVEPVEIL